MERTEAKSYILVHDGQSMFAVWRSACIGMSPRDVMEMDHDQYADWCIGAGADADVDVHALEEAGAKVWYVDSSEYRPGYNYDKVEEA